MKTNNAANGSENTGDSSALQLTVQGLLYTLSPDVVKAIHLAAIPHWSERILLERLVGEHVNREELYARLMEFQFARLDSQGSLHYRSDVRGVLLEWERNNSPQEYLESTQTAMRFFEERSLTATAAELPALQREALYHLLILDEASGLRLLNERLEESCYFRQFGIADMLVEQAVELQDQLSADGKSWLLYFKAILDLVQRRPGLGEDSFRNLVGHSTVPVLPALASWKMGQVRVVRHAWSEAITLYKQSLNLLTNITESSDFHLGRVLMSLGNAYVDLADKGGGVVSPPRAMYGRARRVLNFLLQFPFLALEWLTQRISFLPTAYSGTNYQNWIIGNLRQTAAAWFRRAERQFAIGENPLELTEASLALAKVEHQMGRWSRARHRLATLERIPAVSQSRYRTARVHLNQGQAYFEEGVPSRAIALLRQSAQTFHAFQDSAPAGQADLLLGLAYELQGMPDNAIESFLRSADAFLDDGDKLSLNRTIWNLESLTSRYEPSPELSEKIDSLLANLTERQFLTRFPQGILRLYRRLALLITLPVNYGLTTLANALVLIVVSVVVDNSLQLLSVSAAELSLILVNLVLLTLIILISFWIGRGLYGITGMAAAFILGRQLSQIEQEQPFLLTVDHEGIRCRSTITPTQRTAVGELENEIAPETVQQLAWHDMTACVSVDYKIRNRPIHLISRTLLQAGPQRLVVEGMTTGYDALRREIEKALAAQVPSKKLKSHDFSLLESWSTLASFLFSLGLTISLYTHDRIEFSQDNIKLPIGTIVTFTMTTLLPVLMAVLFWRLWHHRIHLLRVVKRWDTVVPTWLLFVAATFSTVLALGWILLLIFLP